MKMASNGALQTIVVPRTRDLGDGFEVRRALPTTQRRMVGPFVFLDQMGPHRFEAGTGLDVRPHPHIGLATVTFLYDGEIMHRDSLGTAQPIRPGDVNWMTAGQGIVHSERSTKEVRHNASSLFGLQCWVALPRKHEDTAPSFSHFKADELPRMEGDGIMATIIAGSFFSRTSPVPTLSDMFYVDVLMQPGARMTIAPEYEEQAVYVVQGSIDLGNDGVFDAGHLLVIRPRQILTVKAGNASVRFMLLGGEPMDGPRGVVWNFVSSSQDRLEQAKQDWEAGRFPDLPGETERIPLPDDLPGKPVFYP
ncbi:pirin family protein [Herbaspirillum sp. GCM10030257]|uniref:pirin family protein n=1 Tax=Herbaspirillum sp. GCM10030257 TaxID=3273393 RepID=UPI003615FE92